MICKKGVAGETVINIYRLLVISLIALVILGMSAVFYDYEINVRDSEARILVKQTMNCLARNGTLYLENFDEENVLESCGFNSNLDSVYMKIEILNFSDEKIGELKQGDSSLLWIKDIFKDDLQEGIRKYKPGYFPREEDVEKKTHLFPVFLVNDSERKEAKLKFEVLIKNDEM